MWLYFTVRRTNTGSILLSAIFPVVSLISSMRQENIKGNPFQRILIHVIRVFPIIIIIKIGTTTIFYSFIQFSAHRRVMIPVHVISFSLIITGVCICANTQREQHNTLLCGMYFQFQLIILSTHIAKNPHLITRFFSF